MSERPDSTIPTSLGGAKQTLEVLKANMTQEERDDLEAALLYAKKGIISTPKKSARLEMSFEDLENPE